MTETEPQLSKPVAFFRMMQPNRTLMVAIMTGAGASTLEQDLFIHYG